jgi:hypothetical protein
MPATLGSKMPESVLQKHLDRQWQQALANVKARVEAPKADPSAEILAR